jgi:hypothetical protein
VVVASPDITFQLLDGTQAAADAAELQALHAEVYAGPPFERHDDAALFAGRFRVQCRQPGFVLAEARHDARTSKSISAKVRPGCSAVTSPGSGVVRFRHHEVDGRSGIPAA